MKTTELEVIQKVFYDTVKNSKILMHLNEAEIDFFKDAFTLGWQTCEERHLTPAALDSKGRCPCNLCGGYHVEDGCPYYGDE